MRRLSVAACLYGLALVFQQTPSFRSRVEVLAIDVNVVDKSSHVPVADLEPEDFVVTVDYKPRKVVSAQFLRYDVRTAIARARAGVPGEGIVSTGVPAPTRNVLIVIDEDSMEPGDGLLVRKEADSVEVEPADRKGRPHSVSVKVNRRDVEIRARTRYVIPREK